MFPSSYCNPLMVLASTILSADKQSTWISKSSSMEILLLFSQPRTESDSIRAAQTRASLFATLVSVSRLNYVGEIKPAHEQRRIDEATTTVS